MTKTLRFLIYFYLEKLMQVRFYANLRTLVGSNPVEIDDANITTLGEVFNKLIDLYPGIHSHLMDAQDNLRPDVPVFVNGRNPRLDKAGLNIHLTADDVISLFSPIASGKMNVEVMRDQ